jgi:hypothetical protein
MAWMNRRTRDLFSSIGVGIAPLRAGDDPRLLAGGMPVDWLLAIFLTPLAYSALLNCTCVARSGASWIAASIQSSTAWPYLLHSRSSKSW